MDKMAYRDPVQRGIGRRYTRASRQTERRQFRGRKKIARLTRKRDLAKARGKVRKVDKIQRKIRRVAAKTGISTKAPRAPGVPRAPRRAPRHKFRIRKGQRQAWSAKYRGWVHVPSRRRRKTPKMDEEIKAVKDSVDLLRTVIGVMK